MDKTSTSASLLSASFCDLSVINRRRRADKEGLAMQEISYWQFLLRRLPAIAMDALNEVFGGLVVAVLVVFVFRLATVVVVRYMAVVVLTLIAATGYRIWRGWRNWKLRK